MQFFSRKIFYCGSLETSLSCHLEGFDGSGCKGGEKVPLVSQMQGKFVLLLYSLGYSSLGQITSWLVASFGQRQNLSSAPSLWEQGWPEEGFGGLGWFTAYSWLPLRRKGFCSLWWKGKLWIPLQILWFNFLLLFSVIDGLWSCHLNRCSADRKWKSCLFSQWQEAGAGRVLPLCFTPRAQQNPSDAHPRLEGRAEGEGFLSESGAFLSPGRSRCFIALFPLTSCRQSCS